MTQNMYEVLEKQKKEKAFMWHDFYMERFQKDKLNCPARQCSNTCSITNRECRFDDCFVKYWT